MGVTVEAVFFDVGETLIDETNTWEGWANWLGVPRLTFFSYMGTILERGGSLAQMFEPFSGGRSVAELLRERAIDEPDFGFTVDDLYPDARPCLERLRELGYRIGIAGNQPIRAQAVMQSSGLPFEWLVISDVVGLQKPSLEFFTHLCDISDVPAERIAYVGDRIDNDVIPAAAAGMLAVHIRRGPWGYLQASRPGAVSPNLRISSLLELADALPPPPD